MASSQKHPEVAVIYSPLWHSYDHGADDFIFDWYWYGGVKLMAEALERDFLPQLTALGRAIGRAGWKFG